MRLEVRLADVMNYVILLLRYHPRLRRHQTEAACQCLIDGVWVTAVFEFASGEAQRRWQRARLIVSAVAIHAQSVVNRLAAVESRRVQAAQQTRVVNVRLILWDLQSDERRWRCQGRGCGAAPVAKLD